MKAYFCIKTGMLTTSDDGTFLLAQGSVALVNDESRCDDTLAMNPEFWKEIPLWKLPESIRPEGVVRPADVAEEEKTA